MFHGIVRRLTLAPVTYDIIAIGCKGHGIKNGNVFMQQRIPNKSMQISWKE